MSKDPVVESFENLIKLRKQRHALYAGVEKRRADVIVALFGGYPQIDNDEDLNRYGIYMKMVEKMLRYANNFFDGGGNDSLDDLSVFAQMLKQMDEEYKNLGEE